MKVSHADIKQTEENSQGEFLVEENGEKIASLRYLIFGTGKMVLVHTEVGPSLKGQGVARMLLDAAIADARQRKMKVLPQCPYAKTVMYKNRELYNDVLV